MKLPIYLPLAWGIAICSQVFCQDGPTSEEKPVNYWIGELKNKDSTARAKAANTLGELGRKANAAIPTLLESLKDEDTHVRVSAAFALWKIDRNAKVAVPVLV